MKATFEFELPEESVEANLALNAGRLMCALGEIADFCRSKLKYEELSDETQGYLEEIRYMIPELD